MIKVILFDVDNTLLDFHKCAEESIIKAFEEVGLVYKPEYFPVFLEVNNYYWKKFEDGLISMEYLHQHRWKKILEIIGIETDSTYFEKTFIKYLYDSHIVVEGAKEILEYLSKNYELFIVSNSNYLEQLNRLSKAGLNKYFKTTFTSDWIKAAKPTSEFFEKVFQILKTQIKDLEREEILIVGDSYQADIVGGFNYGIKTCWYNFNNQDSRGKQTDFTIKSLLELRDFL